MAGWLTPHADPAELGVKAEWGAFVALVDDRFDQEGQSPAEVRKLLQQLLEVLSGADRSEHPVAAVRALGDLWGRTKAAARPG
ncbi:hypothetical protein AB0A63_39315 [Lentzea sp. NPDC042327]|uniref:hypothetical protein n=1 Tax=Lentzea sp. NPDC042327 TaxID=3154801 RepID=UPI0033F414C7